MRYSEIIKCYFLKIVSQNVNKVCLIIRKIIYLSKNNIYANSLEKYRH